ncbi:MAG: tetratricopeptide repeat protein [Kiritimatiellae bacterium]|nr:tetratricopeptide repeat protein [Kiritimatiellia bacterium]
MCDMRGAAAIVLLAAFASSAPAATELDIAREALRDGLWEIARTHAAASGTNEEARLVILESYAGEGRWKDVRETLSGWPDATGEGIEYYRAVTRGDHAAAAKILRNAGSREGIVAASLFEADELAKSGDRAGAERLWRDVVAASNVDSRALAAASVNLMELEPLKRAYAEVRQAPLRRMVGLRLGTVMVRDPKTAADGAKLVRAIVNDAPDAEGAREAFLAVADAEMEAGDWKAAADDYREAIEIWPDAAKSGAVQEGRGWVLQKLGRREEALEAFRLAGELATNDAARATAMAKEGDILSELGRDEDAMAKYRTVLERYPKSDVAARLEPVVKVRELEAKGREFYREFRFDAAHKIFAEVAAADPARAPRMEFFSILCLYGEGQDDEAGRKAEALAGQCPDPKVRAEAALWLAKFRYNRREWKEAGRLFESCAGTLGGDRAAEALLWASRAAFAENDFKLAIQLSTCIVESSPSSPVMAQALLVQGEALIELARFDEAVLVLERVAAADGATAADRSRSQMLRADALYAMGADNPARYSAALDAYREILFGGILSPGERIVVMFKIARSLEKLKRLDEAIDQYYTKVVLAYRDGRAAHERFGEEARAAFSRAAFRLADEYESRGRDGAAVNVLKLVVESDVHASEEARRRIERISTKGRFL